MQNIAVRVADAVKITGIGRSSLYRLIATGKLTTRKMGRRTLILMEDLLELVKSLPPAVRKPLEPNSPPIPPQGSRNGH